MMPNIFIQMLSDRKFKPCLYIDFNKDFDIIVCAAPATITTMNLTLMVKGILGENVVADATVLQHSINVDLMVIVMMMVMMMIDDDCDDDDDVAIAVAGGGG